MYVRKKRAKHGFGEYLHVVESKRVDGTPRQRTILYVGHYEDIEDALESMPVELKRLRTKATRARKEHERFRSAFARDATIDAQIRRRGEKLQQEADQAARDVDDLTGRLERLRGLVEENPSLRSAQPKTPKSARVPEWLT